MRPPLNAGENCRACGVVRGLRRRFNEAPAERGGKHPRRIYSAPPAVASMRPPLNAGENGRQYDLLPIDAVASMRPPLNAGENDVVASAPWDSSQASMRPPLNAGENHTSAAKWCRAARSFNEAPAERGGKRRRGHRRVRPRRASMRPPLNAGENPLDAPPAALQRLASMRPPLNAGENCRSARRRGRRRRRFNEAPAERGGKRGTRRLPPPRSCRRFNEAPAERGGKRLPGGDRRGDGRRFNEAPAERGGKLSAIVGRILLSPPASMRPPLNAGENLDDQETGRETGTCFNEAPAERGGKQYRLPRRGKPGSGFNEAPAERGGKQPYCGPSDAKRCRGATRVVRP